MSQNRSAWPQIIIGVGVCELAGGLGALATASGVRDWYPTLIKPTWTPPAGVFAPVWIVLYAMMGAALGLIWASNLENPRRKRALIWFGWQLGLNVAWSVVFFGLRSAGWAYIIIIALWLAIAATIWLFSKINRPAAWLLAPYLLWVTFASTLNFAILSLNFIRPGVQKMDADPRNGKPFREAPELKSGAKR